ncbi:hypothetical protein WBG83_07495 [Paenibacillus sp. y28]
MLLESTRSSQRGVSLHDGGRSTTNVAAGQLPGGLVFLVQCNQGMMQNAGHAG